MPPLQYALVAQPDRVVASEAIGRGFESLRAHHLYPLPCGSRFSGDSPLARTTVAQDDSEEDMADRIEAIVMPIFMSATQR